jgi:S1-C subfamily serine protease
MPSGLAQSASEIVECSLPDGRVVQTTRGACRQSAGLVLGVAGGGGRAAQPGGSSGRSGSPGRPRGGASSPAVAAVQTLLVMVGYDVTVDGILGPRTRGAIGDFEESQGMPRTGVPSEELLQRLLIASKGGPDREPPSGPVDPDAPLQVVGGGSGFFVSSAGHILTNDHVIDGCEALQVRTWNFGLYDALVVGNDSANDLGLLKVEVVPPQTATFRVGKGVRVGDPVVTAGFPLGDLLGSQVTITTGNVSSLAGTYNDANTLTVSAPIQPGNSGGPLFDGGGLVVGVMAATFSEEYAFEHGYVPQNINFAIKSVIAQNFLDVYGVDYPSSSTVPEKPPGDVGAQAQQVTVRVDCLARG